MTFWAIGLFFLFYFPMILGITRIRAEIGPPLHQLVLVDPGRTMVLALAHADSHREPDGTNVPLPVCPMLPSASDTE